MKPTALTFRNGPVFDGDRLRTGQAVRFDDGHVTYCGPESGCPTGAEVVDLGGDILSPGYVDLQVNGGGGVMFNDAPSVETLRRIAQAHHRLGVQNLLPTLITDSRATTRAAIAATRAAVRESLPGIVGLHLEGPHLSIARKGAHDAAHIRPMDGEDLAALIEAAAALPVLKVTLAPESVTEDQVAALARAGVLVSLGHTDADFDTCLRYFEAGARCVTHLFNAMSQLGSREPGLVGAALACGDVSAGLIADAVHVHPATMHTALATKTGPGRIFLVSDAMAVAGTPLRAFMLGGRTIRRQDGHLTLADGTLAGADLDLTTAIRILVTKAGQSLEQALQAAVSIPSQMIARPVPRLERLSATLRISADLTSAAWLSDAL